ncbi:major facilitator transporter [Caballeronia catudaia]|uniref:Major facilitator transporter n=1 Tax=Caballeronia catudaia TaxID=1777136 RepID=A0A158A016_9BURK|nr:MFS transporter [Caballeronia catudaia]SAK51105.1 major facilitator transporter [Caballeronia catudaia]
MIRLPPLGRDYYKYASAAFLASFSGGVQFIAISWHLYTSTGSAWSVGVAMIVSTLPGILGSTWIGAFVDRRSPRAICAAADFLRGVAWLCAAVAIQFPGMAIPVIYAALFCSATCDCFFQPAIGGMVRDMVPHERLLQANIVTNMSMQVGVTTGASAGGALVVLIGAYGTLGLVAAALVLSGVLIYSIGNRASATPSPASNTPRSVLTDYQVTFRYLAKNNALLIPCAVLIMAYANMNFCNTAMPIFVARDLKGSSVSFGLVDAFWGFGSIAGGLLLPLFARRARAATQGLCGLLAMSATLTFLSLAGEPVLAAAAMFMMGALNCMMRVSADTAMLQTVVPALYAKVKSLTLMLIACLSLAVYAGVSRWGDSLSMRSLFRVDAALLATFVAAALVCLLGARHASRRDADRSGVGHAAPPRRPSSNHD